MKNIDDKTAIAIINTNVEYIKADINQIKLALKDQYATRESLIQVAKETEMRIVKLENQSNLWRWLNPTISAVMGSVLTFLLINYLQNLA